MSQPSVVRVAQLARGDTVEGLLLVESANFKQNRAGKPFLQLTLRDQSGRIRALQWEADRAVYLSIRVNDVVHVKGRVEEFQGNRQVIVDAIKVLNPAEAPWHLFLPQPRTDPERLRTELRAAVEGVERPELRDLLLGFLDDPEIGPALAESPAGKTLHHAFRGGLLEHIVSIIGQARRLKEGWPELDLDLLIAGALLHDIGKIRELSCERGIQYTDPGQLVGHVALGLAMLREKLAELPAFPAETAMELEHLMVSHHGKIEFGALREPMTAEAIALHFLDNLDARLSAYFALALEEQQSPYGENWTNVNALFGTRLYRPERLRRKD